MNLDTSMHIIHAINKSIALGENILLFFIGNKNISFNYKREKAESQLTWRLNL